MEAWTAVRKALTKMCEVDVLKGTFTYVLGSQLVVVTMVKVI